MAQVPTKRVKIKATGAEATINASDYRPDQHDEVKGDIGHDLLVRVRTASTVEDIDRAAAEIDAAEQGEDGKKRAASDGHQDLRKELDARRAVLLMEKGPKFIREPLPVAAQARTHEPAYVPYMAPPSPGSALRTVGVDPVANAAAGTGQRLSPRTVAAFSGVPALDDTRNPKGKGTDVSALAETAEGSGRAGGAAVPSDPSVPSHVATASADRGRKAAATQRKK